MGGPAARRQSPGQGPGFHELRAGLGAVLCVAERRGRLRDGARASSELRLGRQDLRGEHVALLRADMGAALSVRQRRGRFRSGAPSGRELGPRDPRLGLVSATACHLTSALLGVG